MRPIPEAADVTEADRLQCRTLIEAASFYAVDYDDDGACWERMLPSGDCLVLAVWKSALFGKPERKESTLVRYTGRGTLGDETGPMTLLEALSRVGCSHGGRRKAPRQADIVTGRLHMRRDKSTFCLQCWHATHRPSLAHVFRGMQ